MSENGATSTADFATLSPDRQSLVHQWMPLLHKLCRKWAERMGTPEHLEVLGIGYIGLVRAARAWDPSRTKFSTYAWASIEGELRAQSCLRVRRRERRRALGRREILATDLEGGAVGGGSKFKRELSPFIDTGPTPADAAMQSEASRDGTPAWWHVLNDQEREVVRLRSRGMTLVHTGLVVGVKRARVWQIGREAREKVVSWADGPTALTRSLA